MLRWRRGRTKRGAGQGAPSNAAAQNPAFALPPDAGATLVAAWHDRILVAAPPGTTLALGDTPMAPATSLCGVNLIEDPAATASATRWTTAGEGVRTGVDLLPALRIAGGHTGYLRLDLSARRRLDPAETACRTPRLGAASRPQRLRWSGLFAAQKGVASVRVEALDARESIVARAEADAPAHRSGGQHPAGYTRLGGLVELPQEAVAAALIVTVTPLADADITAGLFTHTQMAFTDGEPQPIAQPLTPLAPLLDALRAGTLQLFAAPLAPLPPAAEEEVQLSVAGTAHVIGRRVDWSGTGRLTQDGMALRIEPGAVDGPLSLLVDGVWVADVAGARAIPDLSHTVPLPAALLDGRTHTMTLVGEVGELARTSIAVLPFDTPWPTVARDVPPPLPGTDAPLASHRYRALAAWTERAAEGREPPFIRAHLPALHQALVKGPDAADPFPLTFAKAEAPDASVVIPAHNAYRLTFIALAALAFAPVEASFEVIVVDDGSTDETATRLAEHDGLTVVRHDTATGFLHAANAGAAAARGRIIVHLNNDTEVTAGWLDPLVEALDRPGVGIAGPKVIYPDGRLQDAGGHISPHLDPVMVGRGGNPFEPRYSYTREVDYISGAALAIPADLWREVGGFSEEFVPAYFEDTDLSFKVREAGHRVLYVPTSVVVHSEGGSHGVDPSGGVKRQQVANAPVFKRKWAHRRLPRLPFERALDRGITARVLFVLADFPRADVDAGSVAALEEIRMIQALGAKVTVAARSMVRLPRYADVLSAMGAELIHAPFYRDLAAFLAERGSEFDAAFITKFQVLEDMLPALRRHAPQAKIILNLADLNFLREMRAAASAADPSLAEAAKGARARELAAMAAADVTCTYSDVERSVVLSHAGPGVKTAHLPWVQRVAPDPAPRAGRAGLAFLGNYRHPPNAEAVRWFAHEVAPKLGATRFHAYGAYAEELGAEIPGAVVEGFAPDLKTMFDRHVAFVAPLLSGAGVKGKVFEALAVGIPVVATPVAAEGLPLRDGESALIAADAAGLAEACARIASDEALWHRLSNAGRALIETHYGFEPGARAMQQIFETAGLFLPLDTSRAG